MVRIKKSLKHGTKCLVLTVVCIILVRTAYVAIPKDSVKTFVRYLFRTKVKHKIRFVRNEPLRSMEIEFDGITTDKIKLSGIVYNKFTNSVLISKTHYRRQTTRLYTSKKSDSINDTSLVIIKGIQIGIIHKLRDTIVTYSINKTLIVKLPRNITDKLPAINSFSDKLNKRILADSRNIAKMLEKQQSGYLCMSNNMGQLGNKLFQFASLYGIAQNFGLKPIIDSKIYARLADRFELKSDLITQVVDRFAICKGFKRQGDRQHSVFDKRLVNKITNNDNHVSGGFLQSWMYFYDLADELREHLNFVDNYRDIAQNALQKATNSIKQIRLNTTEEINFTYVGIHVRRGSLSNKKYAEYGHMVADKEYFKRAISYFDAKYKNVIFIACTNDINWVSENILHPMLVIASLNRPDLDMCILTQCNHTIMSVGTFGWWAAFLANGDTVYYSTPAKSGSSFSGTFSKHLTDFYPPYWIPM